MNVGDRELGHADVDVVASGGELKNVDTDGFIPLLDDRTLPIKFRIEEGVLDCGILVTAGHNYTCGMTTDGTAYCWDHGWCGQLGNGTTTYKQTTPVVVLDFPPPKLKVLHARQATDQVHPERHAASGPASQRQSILWPTVTQLWRSVPTTSPPQPPFSMTRVLALSSWEPRQTPLHDDDVLSRLKQALQDRYTVERELGSGGDSDRLSRSMTVVAEAHSEAAFGGELEAGVNVVLDRWVLATVAVAYDLITNFSRPIGGSRNYSGPQMTLGLSLMLGRGTGQS